MANAFTGFKFGGTLYGGQDATPRITEYPAAAAANLTKGDAVVLGDANRVALGATGNSTFVGVVADGGTYAVGDMVSVIDNHDAIWLVYDQNARVMGANSDIAGATGAQTLAAASNNDFVHARSTGADELSAVMFVRGETRLGF